MYKITNNFHTHTSRCGHAVGEDEEYVINAIKSGIKILGFSDHIPFPGYSQPGIRMDEDLLGNYIESLTFLKEKYKNQIEIHIGLEAEYIDLFDWFYRRLLDEGKIEYLILGQHGDYNEIDGAYFYNAYHNNREMATRYVTQVIKGMESGLFKYVAHPDHFLNGYRLNDYFAESQIRQICQKSKELNIPLEVNLTYPREAIKHGGIHNGLDSYPYNKFWKIAGEYKCPVVFGIDAHDPDDFLLDYSDEIRYMIETFKLNVVSL